MSAPNAGQHVAKGLAQAYSVIERAAEAAERFGLEHDTLLPTLPAKNRQLIANPERENEPRN